MFSLECLEVTPFAQNARILSWPESKQAIVIDPGGEAQRILARLAEQKLVLTEIWLTHSHLDHCGGVAALKASTGAKLLGHQAEKAMRAQVTEICKMYGLPPGLMQNCPEPDRYLSGGERLQFGSDEFEVLYTPGHSPGHVCFYHAPSATLLAGDTLFEGSIGRTDLPGGDHELLLASIREKILTLPDITKVLPGHGPDTTVGRERRSNPFLR